MSKKLPSSLRFLFLGSLLALCLLGLFFVFEASTAESFATYGHQYHFLIRQSVWLVVGLGLMTVINFMPIKLWQKISGIIYGLGLLLLLAVFIPGLGLELNGAHRWLSLGLITLQPVELFKLGLVVFYASWLSQHQRILPFIFLTFLPSLILLLQPDMGSLLIILMIASGMFYTAGGKLKTILPVAVVGAILLLAAIFTSPYRLKRIKTFLYPSSDPLGASFQVRQITLALGNGGIFGQGLGNSQQKYAYIPEASSDSIFAIVAEEVGFIGSVFIIAVYLLYFYAIYRIAGSQKEQSFSQLLALGVLIWIACQALLNLAAIVVLLPLTGLPLPYFSYGGSSLVAMLAANGLLYRVSRN